MADSTGAFARAFRIEMDEAAHACLVDTYRWANRAGYAYDQALNARAEAWAKQVEDAGATWDVLMALGKADA